MPDEAAHQYLFVAIDRASRWVYVEVLPEKTAAQAHAFLNRLVDKAPFTIEKILTDNGKEFTDRFCATGERQPTGRHPFDQGCAHHHIDHRLITPGHPQTNGMVERFNGRISDVLATTYFDSSQALADTLTRYVRLYNHQIPQKALGHLSPVQALKDWQQKEPKRFKKWVYNLTGLDTPPSVGTSYKRTAHRQRRIKGLRFDLFQIVTQRHLATRFDGGIFDSPDEKSTIIERELNQGTLQHPALFLGDSRLDHHVAAQWELDFVFVSRWTEFEDGAHYCATHRLPVIDQISDLLNSNVILGH
jgi:hypothetical protein